MTTTGWTYRLGFTGWWWQRFDDGFAVFSPEGEPIGPFKRWIDCLRYAERRTARPDSTDKSTVGAKPAERTGYNKRMDTSATLDVVQTFGTTCDTCGHCSEGMSSGCERCGGPMIETELVQCPYCDKLFIDPADGARCRDACAQKRDKQLRQLFAVGMGD